MILNEDKKPKKPWELPPGYKWVLEEGYRDRYKLVGPPEPWTLGHIIPLLIWVGFWVALYLYIKYGP